MGILGLAEGINNFFKRGNSQRDHSNYSINLQENNIFQSLFEHHPDIIYTVDLEGNIQSCNKNIEGLLGYSLSEIHGSFQRFIKNDHVKRVINHFQLAVNGQVQNYACHCIHKEGHFIEVQITNIPMYLNKEIVGIYGIAKDLTEVKRTKNRLRENEVQFQQISESLDVGVWSWDTRLHKALFVSSGIETLSGIKRSDFENGVRKWKDLLHPEDLIVFEENQIELRNGKPCQYQYRIIDTSGKAKWVDARTFPVLDSNGVLVRLDGLVTDIHQKKLHEEKINHYAYHDYLTGLANRRMFDEKLEQLVVDNQTKTENFVLLYLDLNRLKFVKDSLGPSIADELLKKAAKRLAGHTKEDDKLARIGEGKFAIILKKLEDPYESITIASKIIKDMQEPFSVNDYHLNITASIGIGIFPQDGQTKDELCANTDVALHRSKGIGKNNLQLYSPSMNIESYKQFVLENDLRKASYDEQFFLHYQPKVDAKTRKIVGAEALIRWNHPEWGLLSPEAFIPLAEETNLIHDLGDWVMASVCKQIKQWREDGKQIVPISINISAKRFLKDDLISQLLKTLEKTNINPKWLEFEITETSLLQNEVIVASVIQELKEIGIAISLDDFGTGYSSISYLKKFKVDYVKIDRSFINGIHKHPDDEAITKTILYLARELKMKVVAEGVETVEQLEFLLKHHCNLIQGYLFSKPVDVEEFTRMITSERILLPGRNNDRDNNLNKEIYDIDLPIPITANMTILKTDVRTKLFGNTQVAIEKIGLERLVFSTYLQLPISKELKFKIETNILEETFRFEGCIIWKQEVAENYIIYGFEINLTEKEIDYLSYKLNQSRFNLL